MALDALARTVTVPVQFRNSKLEFFYGGELPSIKEGTVGDLVIPAHALDDQSLLDLLSRHQDIEFFPKGTVLLAGLRAHDANLQLRAKYPGALMPSMFGGSAEIVLLEPLGLRIRGAKKGMLKPCRCRLPAILDREGQEETAGSVNHAYTRLSEQFEKNRRSHTGNVFETVFYEDSSAKDPKVWRPLGDRRLHMESLVAQRFRDLAKRGSHG